MKTTTQHVHDLEAFARRTLTERQRALAATREHAEREARDLFETKETDWEDRAANVSAATELERLGDNERAELLRVMAALERLDAGVWGKCMGCGQPIPEARLRVAPEAARCAACAQVEPIAPHS